ncbi:MAG: hypothetical protein RMA76_19240 [Deltaproteobacteria bacterium]|jgi:hypothetical protein
MTALLSFRRRNGLVALLTVALAGAACSGNTSDDDTDVMDRDGGFRDGGPPPDGGVLATCTIPENNPECVASSDCGDERNPQADCPDCPVDYGDLCYTGQCQTPTPIPSGNSHVVNIGLTGLETDVQSIITMAVDREPAGGLLLSCADVPATIAWNDWHNPCFNVLRTKYLDTTDNQQNYRVNMSLFASERPVMFITYGFDELTINDGLQPIAVDCVEFDVGVADPMGGLVEVAGGVLQRIQ